MYSTTKNSSGAYDVFQNGSKVATGSSDILGNYGLSVPQSAATKVDPATPATSPVTSLSTNQGAKIVAAADKSLANLTATPTGSTGTTKTDTTKTTPIDTVPAPAKVTLLNPTTGQSSVFDDASLNKDAIQALMNSGYQVTDTSGGTLPSWLVASTTGTTDPALTAEGKAKQAVDDASTDLKTLTDSLSKYTISDAQLQSQISSITSQWDARIADMQKINQSRTSNINTTGLRLGSQYAGGSGGTFGGIISEEERQGVARIGDLEAQKQAAISAARSAAATQNWTVYSKQVDLAEKAYSDKITALKDLQTATAAQNKVIADTLQKNADNLNAAKKDAYDTALKNNAPKEVLDAIANASNQSDAYGAIQGYGGTQSNQVVDINGSKALVDTTPGNGAGKIIKWLGGGSGDNTGSGGPGGTNAVLTDNYKDFLTGKTVDQVAAFNNLSSLDKSTISSLINGDVLLSDIVKTRGIQGTKATEALLQKAKTIDPTFSPNENKIRYDFNKDWQASDSKVGVTKNAINTALGHLAEVKTASANLSPSDLQIINKTKNWWDAQTGNSNITNLQFGLTQLASEIATAYKGGAPSQGEVDAEKAVLGTEFSKEQMAGVLNTASQFLSSKITSMRYLYKSTMGKEYGQSLIDPDKRQALIDAGINDSSIVKENVPGTGTVSTGDKITTALNTVNPTTGQKYTSHDIVSHLLKDPVLGPKISSALNTVNPDTGKFYSFDEIAEQLKQL